MKYQKLIFLFMFAMSSFANQLSYGAKISIIYPREGDTISAADRDSTFIFGQVTPADADFYMNNTRIDLYPNGTFLAFLPVISGYFRFHSMAVSGKDTVYADRNIYIPPLQQSISADTLLIQPGSGRPSVNYSLQANDLLRVSFTGTPNCRAFFSVDSLCEYIPMVEESPETLFNLGESVFGEGYPSVGQPLQGIYSGSYLLQNGDYCKNAGIHFILVNADNDTVTAQAGGVVTVLDSRVPRMVELTREETVLRTGRNTGYYYFLPAGVRLWITGQKGEYLRARFTENEEGWVQANAVRDLPAGTVPLQVILNIVRSTDLPDRTRILAYTREKTPFRIEQDIPGKKMHVYFYGVISDTDFIRHLADNKYIQDIQWNQVSPDMYKLTIELLQDQQWGYNVFYDKNEHFTLDIKKPPRVAGWPWSPLKNVMIMLDPGHSPDNGAVGATGLTEKEANADLALVLGKKLKDKGAIVFYTHDKGEGITLRERKRLVEFVGADIMLSLHHNAVPDGIDPFKSRGTSVYYFQPQSYALAEIIHEKLLGKLKLNDFGLFYDNLAMCRPTQMPAVLIEPAFMMHPEEEMLIASKKYRNKCSDAIVEALEEYLKAARQ